jgi:hypothetical protein
VLYYYQDFIIPTTKRERYFTTLHQDSSLSFSLSLHHTSSSRLSYFGHLQQLWPAEGGSFFRSSYLARKGMIPRQQTEWGINSLLGLVLKGRRREIRELELSAWK